MWQIIVDFYLEVSQKKNELFGQILLTMGNSVHEQALDRDFDFNVLVQSSTIIVSILT